ncbi:hypothetical protein TNCV_3693991 [Trichonephila clavipes]|nr:hypothetical protein TNCV_3693991 [Trichonephila clavipes]
MCENDPHIFDNVITSAGKRIFEYDPESKKQSAELHSLSLHPEKVSKYLIETMQFTSRYRREKKESIALLEDIFKKQRKAINIKMKIIQDHEAGQMVKEISCNLKLAHSTILKNKVTGKEVAKSSTGGGVKTIKTKQRKGFTHEMEELFG